MELYAVVGVAVACMALGWSACWLTARSLLRTTIEQLANREATIKSLMFHVKQVEDGRDVHEVPVEAPTRPEPRRNGKGSYGPADQAKALARKRAIQDLANAPKMSD